MNNKISAIIFLFLLLCLSFANDFNEYSQELVKTFPEGNRQGELGIQYMRNAPELDSYFQGPSGLSFDTEGNLYICDTINDKFVIFDMNFNYKKTIMIL